MNICHLKFKIILKYKYKNQINKSKNDLILVISLIVFLIYLLLTLFFSLVIYKLLFVSIKSSFSEEICDSFS
jgi:hypothetical protein